jgi:hypothetical protein
MRTCGVESGVVRQGLHVVDGQQFSDFFHLLAAQAVHDARLALVELDVLDELFLGIDFRPHLVVEVFAVERRLEQGRLFHLEVALNVSLHLGRGRGRKGDDGQVAQAVDDALDLAVLGPEVVPPLGDAVGLVDGHQRDVGFLEKGHVLFLGEGFGRHVEQLGFAAEHVLFHLRHLGLREGGVENWAFTLRTLS